MIQLPMCVAIPSVGMQEMVPQDSKGCLVAPSGGQLAPPSALTIHAQVLAACHKQVSTSILAELADDVCQAVVALQKHLQVQDGNCCQELLVLVLVPLPGMLLISATHHWVDRGAVLLLLLLLC